MGLTMKERKAVTKEVAKRYQQARKVQKIVILDEFVALTDYSRCYASYVLRNLGRKIRAKIGGKMVTFIGERTERKVRRNRTKEYGRDVRDALVKLWVIADYICGKRLKALLKDLIERLEKFEEIKLAGTVRVKLLRISAATIDRLLANEKKKYALKARSRTKPGTLLKHQVPIRTFADWDDKRPGFVEVDLVSHEGGTASGDFIQTLDVTDVCTGWTETQGVRNKAQVWVFGAMKEIAGRLPFKLQGIDSDNGAEFINAHMLRFCRENGITSTRTRANR